MDSISSNSWMIQILNLVVICLLFTAIASTSAETTETPTTVDFITANQSTPILGTVEPETTHQSTTTDDLWLTTTDEPTEISTIIDYLNITTDLIRTETTSAPAITTLGYEPVTTKLTTRSQTVPPVTGPVTGPVPDPEFPDLDESARKIIIIEISVLDESNCFPDLICEEFEAYFVEQVKSSYGIINGFEDVAVIQLRNETDVQTLAESHYVIVQHNVTYIWNTMDELDRGLSADEIYDHTVGPSVTNGKIGNLTAAAECNQCAEPMETTNLCNNDDDITCSKYFDLYCLDDMIPACQSKCLNTEDFYCGRNGICTHTSPTSQPTCNCLHDPDIFYFGEYCQLEMDKLIFLICSSIGGFIILLLLVILCVCLVTKNRKKKHTEKKRSTDEEELGVQNYGFTTEMYDPSKPDAVVLPITNQTSDRPYSYRDSYLADGARRPPSQTYGNQLASEAAKKQAEKNRNSAFWGNLNHDTNGVKTTARPPSGGFELQPILTHIDSSEEFHIQRPKSRTSTSFPDVDSQHTA